MCRILMMILLGTIAGCTSSGEPGNASSKVYLDLIVKEGGQSKFPDPLRTRLPQERPATLTQAAAALIDIVPIRRGSRVLAKSTCPVGSNVPLSNTFQLCKYEMCKYLPEGSRAQDCGYFVRLEQWIQKEWLGGLCQSEGFAENLPLTKWFHDREVSDCLAMSELVMIAYMQEITGTSWSESQLLELSSNLEDLPVQP